jgi:hypothetical protein
VIKFFTPLRMTDAELLAGDIVVHGEVAYPEEEPDRVPAMVGDGTPDGGPGASYADTPSEVVSD